MTLLQTQNMTIVIGKKNICQQLHLSLSPGEILGILGPNGSGKTTLLHALAGLHPLSDGEIFIDSQPLSYLSIKERAQKIGVLFQDTPFLFSQTVEEYALTGRYPHLSYFKTANNKDRQIIAQALQTVNMSDFAQKKVAELSGGEKRRLAIATLLVQTPQLYLLDEPTNHLDIRYQIAVLTHLRHLAAQGAAIILTLHDVNLAQQFCDRVLLMKTDGQIAVGKTSSLLTTENLHAVYQCAMTPLVHNDITYWIAGR